MTLRKLFVNLSILLICAFAVQPFLTACDDDDYKSDWEKYASWRDYNQKWMDSLLALRNPAGDLEFHKISPSYNPTGVVYMRWFGDRYQNAENLQPLYTSYISVNYVVRLADGTQIDSAANYTVNLNSQSLITGWATAIQQMHVGDTVEVIMPYNVAYGTTGSGSVPPYSALRFNLRLVDIPNYETRP